MSTADLDPIPRACCLLREGAAELKNCHTLASTGHDWTGEPEAKAAYDEHMATADALERWADSIGAGGVESLRGRQCLHRISEPAGEYPALPDAAGVVVEHVPVGGGWVRHYQGASYTADKMRAYVDADRAMRVAQPAGAQQPGAAYAALPDELRANYLDLLQEVMDAKDVMLAAGCQQDSFGAMFAEYSASHGQAPASRKPKADSVDYVTEWAVTLWKGRERIRKELRVSHGQAPATLQSGEQPLPLLVKDIAADLATTPIQVCMALSALGFGGHSVNMAVTPTMAQALRAHFSATEQAAPAAAGNAVVGCNECHITHDLGACTTAAPAAVAGPTRDLNPEKCPITGRPYFMTLDHPELGPVPTYGGPFDSYTIPAPEGEPTDPWHERELRSERYDHDAGWWVEGGEPIPLRIVHEDVLFKLQEHAGADTPTTQPAPQQEAASVDLKTMELAESVGLIGPASRTHDLHAAIQRFHDLICANATIKAAQMAAEAIDAARAAQEGKSHG